MMRIRSLVGAVVGVGVWVGVVGAACTPVAPRVTMGATRVDVAAGGTGSVDFTVMNRDSVGCPAQGFDLGPALGYYGGLPASDVVGYGLVGVGYGVTLAPGEQVSASVRVTFVPTAVPGKYVSLLLHAYRETEDLDVYFYQSGLGRTEFYVEAPGVCLPDAAKDTICTLLGCYGS